MRVFFFVLWSFPPKELKACLSTTRSLWAGKHSLVALHAWHHQMSHQTTKPFWWLQYQKQIINMLALKDTSNRFRVFDTRTDHSVMMLNEMMTESVKTTIHLGRDLTVYQRELEGEGELSVSVWDVQREGWVRDQGRFIDLPLDDLFPFSSLHPPVQHSQMDM